VGRHKPEAQLVFGALVGGLEALVCEWEILANRRDQIARDSPELLKISIQ